MLFSLFWPPLQSMQGDLTTLITCRDRINQIVDVNSTVVYYREIWRICPAIPVLVGEDIELIYI